MWNSDALTAGGGVGWRKNQWQINYTCQQAANSATVAFYLHDEFVTATFLVRSKLWLWGRRGQQRTNLGTVFHLKDKVSYIQRPMSASQWSRIDNTCKNKGIKWCVNWCFQDSHERYSLAAQRLCVWFQAQTGLELTIWPKSVQVTRVHHQWCTGRKINCYICTTSWNSAKKPQHHYILFFFKFVWPDKYKEDATVWVSPDIQMSGLASCYF